MDKIKKNHWSGISSLLRRLLLGGKNDAKIESPLRIAIRSFFRRKSAVSALVILVLLVLFVFVGSAILPMDVGYTDTLSAYTPPTLSLLSVPRGLRGGVKTISSYSTFSVGVGMDGSLYTWGNTKLNNGTDLAEYPAEAQDGVYAATAGYDHIVALTKSARLVAWGSSERGQLGDGGADTEPIPEELRGTIDPTLLDQLQAGYQVTAVVYDGKAYMFGNTGIIMGWSDLLDEMEEYSEMTGARVKKIALSAYSAVALFDDGRIVDGGYFSRASAVGPDGERIADFLSTIGDKRVVDIAATVNSYAILCEGGELYLTGDNQYGECNQPTVLGGQKVVSVSAGSRHFVALTDGGGVLAWGHNDSRQCNITAEGASAVFAGFKQSYATGRDGVLVAKSGRRGYALGTDSRGRDVLTRIVHGGRMTLTVGAVAVIISTAIAVVIGCISGYFGGWVDILLMRASEIFSAIPFLPFALLLSFIMRNYPTSENFRIFIIMLILGVLSWPTLARLIRGQVLSCREMEYVSAARAMGVPGVRIAFGHILPNIISAVLVSVTLDFAACLLTESSLSYLGFGVQQPSPSWGNMLGGANNSAVIQGYPWTWLAPALFLSVATVCINIIGDALRDAFDPKSEV